MDLKLLVFVTLFGCITSAPNPQPEPDADIQIDVRQEVNGGGCCPGSCCSKEEIGCVFAGKSYPDKSLVTDACLDLVCNKGVWKQKGDIKEKCGNCSALGDPHIKPYEYHDFGLNQYIDGYHYYEIGNSNLSSTYTLSQKGLYTNPGSFGVYADIETCEGGAGVECISKVIYSDPILGGNVEVVLPKKLYDATFCQTSNPIYAPDCDTKVFNNAGSSVIIFDEDGDCTYCRQIYIVGSKGIIVSLLVDPYAGWLGNYLLSIYAMPSLKNELFGLCDRFTGSDLDDYTLLGGSVITTVPLKPFIDSWEY